MRKNNNKKIKARFAPSPTGYLHVGSLRTYLYNWLFVKKNNGQIILRIEDTDRKRYISGAAESLIKTIKKFNLPWDKGPFFQSQKIGNYRSLAQKLVDQDKAYYCFCSPKRLEEMRKEQIEKKEAPHYDRKCRFLTKQEIKEKLKNKEPYVIRLKVPEQGKISFKDLVRGKVEFDLKTIDDQVLLKSDGWPTYHLANVVDDHFMGITHVIRGEEWLPSTPKHILVYQSFGWEIPFFAHLPLLLNADHSKLSKRQGDVAVEDYLAQGYLPETLINFLSLMGWNPDNDQEILSLEQLKKSFSLSQIQKAGAVFDRKKLDWMNGYYIRELPLRKLTKYCLPYLIQSGLIDKKNYNYFKIKKIISLEQERLKKLEEISSLAELFFKDELKYDPHLLFWKKMTLDEIRENLNLVRECLNNICPLFFKSKNIFKKIKKIGKEKGMGQVFWPWRVSLSGQKNSPPPQDIAEVLGKKRTIKRIEKAINSLK